MNSKLFLYAAVVALTYSSLSIAMTAADKQLMQGIKEVDMKKVKDAVDSGASIDIKTPQGQGAFQAALDKSNDLGRQLASGKHASKYGFGSSGKTISEENKLEKDSLEATAISLYIQEASAKKRIQANPELENALADLKMLMENEAAAL